jgi:hypothetical protein
MYSERIADMLDLLDRDAQSPQPRQEGPRRRLAAPTCDVVVGGLYAAKAGQLLQAPRVIAGAHVHSSPRAVREARAISKPEPYVQASAVSLCCLCEWHVCSKLRHTEILTGSAAESSRDIARRSASLLGHRTGTSLWISPYMATECVVTPQAVHTCGTRHAGRRGPNPR